MLLLTQESFISTPAELVSDGAVKLCMHPEEAMQALHIPVILQAPESMGQHRLKKSHFS